jgi:hypothetical protein
MPEPATRSLIVRETTMSSAPPRLATREVMCTAMPLYVVVRNFDFAGVNAGANRNFEGRSAVMMDCAQ